MVLRIHYQNDDLGEADRAQRVGHRQLLQLFLDARPAAQPRGVEHPKRTAVPADIDGDGIACGAGLGARQQPFLAEQLIDQCRLAGVGTADDRYPNGSGLDIARLRFGTLVIDVVRFRHDRSQRIIKIAGALAVLGGDRNGIAKT